MRGKKMSKFCQKCGTELNDDAKFCNACGTSTENQGNINVATPNNNAVRISRKEILTTVLLSLVTCGIYGIFWFISIALPVINHVITYTNAFVVISSNSDIFLP